MQQKKGGAKKLELIDDTSDEDIGRYRECGDEWHGNSSDCSIVCDICSERVHLQCSGLMYKQQRTGLPIWMKLNLRVMNAHIFLIDTEKFCFNLFQHLYVQRQQYKH